MAHVQANPGLDPIDVGCSLASRSVFEHRAVVVGASREQLIAGLAGLVGDETVGVTTSGTFSPTLQVGIGLALIDSDAGIEDGQQINVDVRGRAVECQVVCPPFVAVKTR